MGAKQREVYLLLPIESLGNARTGRISRREKGIRVGSKSKGKYSNLDKKFLIFKVQMPLQDQLRV